MDTLTREYAITIGDHGGWQNGHAPDLVDRVKEHVRKVVKLRFADVVVPWSFDLDALLVANSIFSSPKGHYTIPDAVHFSILRGWIAAIQPQLGNRTKLWIPEDEAKAMPDMDMRCCAMSGNGWRACWLAQAFEGESLAKAKPWVVSFAAGKGKEPIKVPILIQASWHCEMMDMPTMAPMRTGRQAIPH